MRIFEKFWFKKILIFSKMWILVGQGPNGPKLVRFFVDQALIITDDSSGYKLAERNGETQILFRDLPKFSNFGKTFRSSCQVSKLKAFYKIWVHGLVSDSRNSAKRFWIWEWDKYSLKSFFSKTVGAIVINVPRSISSPKIMNKDLQILVFSGSWTPAILIIGNHELLKKIYLYILNSIFMFSIE